MRPDMRAASKPRCTSAPHTSHVMLRTYTYDVTEAEKAHVSHLSCSPLFRTSAGRHLRHPRHEPDTHMYTQRHRASLAPSIVIRQVARDGLARVERSVGGGRALQRHRAERDGPRGSHAPDQLPGGAESPVLGPSIAVRGWDVGDLRGDQVHVRPVEARAQLQADRLASIPRGYHHPAAVGCGIHGGLERRRVARALDCHVKRRRRRLRRRGGAAGAEGQRDSQPVGPRVEDAHCSAGGDQRGCCEQSDDAGAKDGGGFAEARVGIMGDGDSRLGGWEEGGIGWRRGEVGRDALHAPRVHDALRGVRSKGEDGLADEGEGHLGADGGDGGHERVAVLHRVGRGRRVHPGCPRYTSSSVPEDTMETRDRRSTWPAPSRRGPAAAVPTTTSTARGAENWSARRGRLTARGAAGRASSRSTLPTHREAPRATTESRHVAGQKPSRHRGSAVPALTKSSMYGKKASEGPMLQLDGPTASRAAPASSHASKSAGRSKCCPWARRWSW
eukprot:scaffold20361_cov102-Isochrysis_galbana.AAC.13